MGPDHLKVEVHVHVNELTIKVDSPQIRSTERHERGPEKKGPHIPSNEELVRRAEERFKNQKDARKKVEIPEVKFGQETS
jgi:hypothetical protein